MSEYSQQVPTDKIKTLRDQGIITDKEVAYFSGDLVIAENVLTKERRIIGPASDILAESSKRLLKG